MFDEHVRRGKSGGGNAREMDFESFLDFVLALENKDTPEGLTYLFRCLDLNGRGYLSTADIHSLFRSVFRSFAVQLKFWNKSLMHLTRFLPALSMVRSSHWILNLPYLSITTASTPLIKCIPHVFSSFFHHEVR